MQSKNIIVGFALLFFAFFVTSQNSLALAAWLIDRSGTLVQVDGFVLGDDSDEIEIEEENEVEVEVEDEDEDDERNDETQTEKRAREQAREAEKDRLENERELAKQKLEKEIEARKKAQERLKQTIKTQVKSEDGVLRVRQEVMAENGQVLRNTDQEIPIKEKLRVEKSDGSFLEINALKDKLEITTSRLNAHTSLPLSLGENNELIVTRADGEQKIVSVLPDEAADKLASLGLLTTDESVELEIENEIPVYKFSATEDKKVLGLFKLAFKKRAYLSAESGEVVLSESAESTPFKRFLESISF
ncbi:MAG: hypothetical protein UY18_C0001G0024 [Microgenomates group bacterium GW2011_GWF2_47_9]|nr:MAG: hypothetical protein UY18_C0001G0024 [Microgenomates group bacterium GW2011_GWF2_47_9]